MDLFARFRNSWEITKACFGVLSKEKMLVLYPLISMLSMGVVLMVFFGAFFFAVLASSLSGSMGIPVLILTVLLVWLMYVALYAVSIFSNVAIVGAANMRLEGKDPTFSDGLKISLSRIGPILGWAAVAATVGIILQMIKERAGTLGKIVANMLGLAWNIITYFVVPVIAFENIGPFSAIKRSVQILKKTWGEALVVNFGIGFVFGLVMVLYIVIWLVLIFATAILWPLMLVIVALGFMGLLVLWAVYTALKGVLMAVLYRYATTGKTGFGIEKAQVESMFAPRTRHGFF